MAPRPAPLRSVRRSRCDPGPGTARNLHGGEEGEEGGEEAGEEEEEGEEKLQWPLLKSRDPHLAGGEQTKTEDAPNHPPEKMRR